MPSESFDTRFRMRRPRFPHAQPAGAPLGYIDSICWLGQGVLWIDGWLTLKPTPRLEIELEIGGRPVSTEATCITSPPLFKSTHGPVRRWFCLIPLEGDLALASHVNSVSLKTPLGLLQWLGGFHRLIAPDFLFRTGSFDPEMRRGLGAFVERCIERGHLRAEDPVLRRNLALVDQQLAPATGQPQKIRSSEITRVDHEVVLGRPPAEPRVSLLINLLIQPDLLEHHFLQLAQAGDLADWEILLVVNPETDTSGLDQRLEGLVNLYRVPVRVLFLASEPTWASALATAVKESRGEILVLQDGHALSAEAGGLTALVEPLADGRAAIISPLVEHFDGNVRSAGFTLDWEADETGEATFLPLPPSAGATRIDACGSDAFALPRSLYDDLGGLVDVYTRVDYEAVDLCLRAGARGFPVVRLPIRFTRFIETAPPPPLSTRIEPDVWDLFLLERRHRTTEASFPRETSDREPADRTQAASADPAPRASVVIPTLNPGRDLVDVLDRLEAQEGAPDFEILVIDSGSRDGTQRTLKKRGIRYQVIDRQDFNHGLTRNLGIRQARGEVVALLSQDALPEPGWLAGLVAAFDDPRVAGAYSRQRPRRKASTLVRDQLSRWPASDEESRRQEIGSLKAFLEQPLADQLDTVCFDNVSSAVRRSVALEIPFRALRFGEDRDWSYRVQAAGHAIRYCAASEVLHSHERSAWYELRRTYVDHRLIRGLLPGTEEPRHPPAFLPWWRAEWSRLRSVAGGAPSAWRRWRSHMAAPLRAAAGVGGAYLAQRAATEVVSGSRSWRWLHRRLDQGL